MEESIKIFGNFKIKELHSIHNFFDIDKNGVVDEKEFKMQLKRAFKKYNKSKK